MSMTNSKTASTFKLLSNSCLIRTSLTVALSLGLMACGGGEHEVHAVDKVEEAAELARANAPEAEIVELEDTKTTTAEDDPASDSTASSTEVQTEATEDTAISEEAVTADEPVSEPVSETGEEETPEPAQAPEAETAATSELSATAGKELYESTCHVCHESGLLGAPVIGDTVAWEPRIAKGIETLHQHSAEGFKGMPPQATGEVSKEQVYAAVDYMVAQSS